MCFLIRRLIPAWSEYFGCGEVWQEVRHSIAAMIEKIDRSSEPKLSLVEIIIGVNAMKVESELEFRIVFPYKYGSYQKFPCLVFPLSTLPARLVLSSTG